MDNVLIRAATEGDARSIHNFENFFFHNCEPLELSHPESGHKNNNFEELRKLIIDGYVLIAVEESNLVGILIAGKMENENLDESEAASIEEPKRADILNFLAFIKRKANFGERFKVNEYFHIHIVSVHPFYRGRKIAMKLFQSSFALAKFKNYQLITVDCTSFYSAKIAERLDMECISTVTYQEYNNYIGKPLFIPSPPHVEIKSFAKILYTKLFN